MNQSSGPPGWPPPTSQPSWGPPAADSPAPRSPGWPPAPPGPPNGPPTGFGWSAPPPPPPPRRGGLIILLVVGIVVVLIAGVGISVGVVTALRERVGTDPFPTATPDRRPSVSRPTPQSTPTPQPTTPSPSPTPSKPTAKEPQTGLIKNSIYGLELDRGEAECSIKVRRPKPPLKNSKLKPYLEDLVDCMVKVYRKPFAKIGFELSTPRIRPYSGKIAAPCGDLDQHGSPAYYCSADETIYWPVTSDDGREAYTFARLGYVGLLAHEFGHHLQAETGMFREYSYSWAEASEKKQLELSRRLELQAQCFEGVFLSYAEDAIELDSSDLYEIREWHSYTGDEDPPSSRKPDHGSSSAQYRWLERGYESTDFGRCNTWKASDKSVR
jgi:predicted metalloprotease